MFELVYLARNGVDRETEYDATKVRVSSVGVSIKLTQGSSVFIPWNRVVLLATETPAIDKMMEMFDPQIAPPENQVNPEPVFYPNTGHGHVYPRPDGVKARCGGPGFCAVCSADLRRKNGETHGNS